MQANMQLIVELEAKYQATLQKLLIEREHNEEERETMRRELDFVTEELNNTSSDLEAMIERNNRGVLLKLADSDVAKLVFGSQPGASVVGLRGVIRLGILGGAVAMLHSVIKQMRSKSIARA